MRTKNYVLFLLLTEVEIILANNNVFCFYFFSLSRGWQVEEAVR